MTRLRSNERYTDIGNATVFLNSNADDLRYCPEWGKWLIWNGTRWSICPDDSEAINRGILTIRRMLVDARAANNRNDVDWAIKCHDASRIRSMVNLAAKSARVSITSADLDNDSWIINVRNGIVNLRTGELVPHDRLRLCTKIANTTYDPYAICPRWVSFLDWAMNGDSNLVNMLQRIVGYCLTGDVGEQALFFFFGEGQNGKSTFLSTIQSMLGDYVQPAPRGLLESDRNNDHDTRIAALYRARLVLGSEIEAGKHLAESMIKDLTGGEKIAARRMREDYWYFDPTHKIIITGNHKPKVTGTDFGFWRRMKLIPWTKRVTEAEKDPDLKKKLEEEFPGILNWATMGCVAWKTEGGLRTDLVAAATETYRVEQRDLQRFPEIFTEFCSSNLEFDPRFLTPKRNLWEIYENWSKLNNHPIAEWKQLYKFLREERDLRETTMRDPESGSPVRAWAGVKIKIRPEN